MEGDESKPPSLPEDSQSEHSAGLAGDVKGSHSESSDKHISSTVKDEPVSDKKLLQDGNTKLKPESQENESGTETEKSHLEAMEAEMTALQKQVADLQLMMSESNLRIKTIEEELERSRKCLSESDTEAEKSHLEDNEAEMVALQKQVDDLKLLISELDIKFKTMEEELESSTTGLAIAKETISSLQGQLKDEVETRQKRGSEAHEKVAVHVKNVDRIQEKSELLAAEIVIRNDEISKLKTKNERYKSEASQLEETLKTKEGIWNHDVIKLKEQVNNESKAYEDLKKQLNSSRADRNRLNGQIDTLKEEKCSQEKLIQELQTSLNALQVEHDGVVSSYESTEKLKDDLTLRVVELEREVHRQREVISVTTEEKTEVISQLNTSRSDTNTLNGKLEMLEEENYSQEKLIQELQTHLNMQVEQKKKVKSELQDAKTKISELEVLQLNIERNARYKLIDTVRSHKKKMNGWKEDAAELRHKIKSLERQLEQ